MYRNRILVFAVVMAQQLSGQIKLGVTQNIDVYKPYTPEGAAYAQKNDNVRSSTHHLYLNYTLKRNRFSWNTGFVYQKTSMVVEEKIKTYYTYQYSNSAPKITEHNDPLDLKSRSLSFGVMNEFAYKISKNEQYQSRLGISSEVYLLEFFRSHYYYHPTNEMFKELSVDFKPITSELPARFFFSGANLSVFYKITAQLEAGSIAARISLGTNLYSNWDQFRKYAWIGAGLEFGFGKKDQ